MKEALRWRGEGSIRKHADTLFGYKLKGVEITMVGTEDGNQIATLVLDRSRAFELLGYEPKEEDWLKPMDDDEIPPGWTFEED